MAIASSYIRRWAGEVGPGVGREGETCMSLEENEALVRRYFEDATHNPEICDEIFARVPLSLDPACDPEPRRDF
jgi:hypothetical protein